MCYRILLVIFLSSSGIYAQQTQVKDAFLEKWNNSKDYLITMAQSMPNEYYDYTPVAGKMSFKEQLLHIKGNMDWLASSYFGLEKNKKDLTTATKQEIISALSSSFDQVYTSIKNTPQSELSATVDFFAGPKSKLQIINLLQDHVTHHRGQLIMYMNLKNIELPRYTGW